MSTGERHHVRLFGAPEILPGEYTLVDGATVERLTTTVPCPYCRTPMIHLKTAGALRVAQQLEPPRHDSQLVMAERVPDGLRVLKCALCDVIFCALEQTP